MTILKSAALKVNPYFKLLFSHFTQVKSTTGSMALSRSMQAETQRAEGGASGHSHISAPSLWTAARHANTQEIRSSRTKPITDGDFTELSLTLLVYVECSMVKT